MLALKKYRTLTLFGANVILALLALFLYDPFHWFRGGYDSAPRLLRLTQEDVSKIEILPDGKRVSATLDRGREISGVNQPSPGGKEADAQEGEGGDSPFMGALFQKRKHTYQWTLTLERPAHSDRRPPSTRPELPESPERADGMPGASGESLRYGGDANRIVQLFDDLEKARRYYSLEASEPNLAAYGMKSGSDGSCECLAIRLHTNGGSRVHTLYVGHSSIRSGESYVRLDDEKRIYQVRSNLSGTAGADDPLYFRNRAMALSFLPLDSITGVEAHFPAPGRDVQMSKGGTGWQMIAPVPGPAKAGEINSMLEEMHGWRVQSFPDAVPPDLDRKSAFKLNIVYRKSLTEPGTIQYDVLGKKGYNVYLLRDEKGNLVEVISYYLDSFLDPVSKLAASGSPAQAGAGGGGYPSQRRP